MLRWFQPPVTVHVVADNAVVTVLKTTRRDIVYISVQERLHIKIADGSVQGVQERKDALRRIIMGIAVWIHPCARDLLGRLLIHPPILAPAVQRPRRRRRC